MILEVLRINRENLEPLKDKFKGVKALKMMKIFKKIDEEIKILEEFKNKLIIKYGEKEDEEFVVKKDSEKFNSFVEEYYEAARQEIDLNVDLILNEQDIENFTVRELEFLELIGAKIE